MFTQATNRIALLACAALAFAGCAGAAPPVGSPGGGAATGDTIKIGALLPLTGDGANYGPGMQAAIQIAVDEVNAAGGVLGKQLQLVTEDDATNPDQGVRGAHKLIDVNKVNAIVGTWASSVTLAVTPLTIPANIIEINVSGSPQITELQDNGTVFRANATDAALAKVVADQFYRDGIRTVTVISNNTAGTIGLADSFKTSFTAAGGQVLETITYAEGQPSYRSEVNKALATKPDLFLVSCYTPDGTLIFKEAFEAGATGKWAAPAFCLNNQLVEGAGTEAVEGAIAFDLVAVKDSPAYQRLNEAYKAKTGEEAFDNVYAVHVYDAVHLLALAMQKAGSTDGQAVGAQMIEVSKAAGDKVSSFSEGAKLLRDGGDVDYDGASGAIDFDQAGDMAPYVGIFVFKAGKPELTQTFAGQ